MDIIKKEWFPDFWIEGEKNSYTNLSGTTEEYSENVFLEAGGSKGAHVGVEVDFNALPTDDIEVAIYSSLDGSSYDDVPMYKMVIDNGVDRVGMSFIVKDVAHFRIGFKQTGSTDNHGVKAHYQAWRYANI